MSNPTTDSSLPALAIDGGPQAATDLEIPAWPQVPEESFSYVRDCIDSGAWCRLEGDAEYVERFEREFADYHDAEHAIAVANGTVAIELALRMCGVQPGDEVLVPSYTFIATASAVACMGAVPCFVDVDPRTYNVDPDSIRESISEDTVGLVAVHFGGYPIDFDEISEIVDDHDLFLIEDAAHAHGSEWRGEKVGTIGDVGTFSFQASKPVSGGEGGIVLTDDEIMAEDGELLHNIGRKPGKPGYRHYVLSSNYRLSEVGAALLCGQFEAFPEQFRQREEAAVVLREGLEGIEGIVPQPSDDRVTARGYASFSIAYDREGFGGLPRDTFVEALSAEGVPVGTGYGHSLTEQPAFARDHLGSLLPDEVDPPLYRTRSLPGTEESIATRVSFSHRYLLADSDDLDAIVRAVRKLRAHAESGTFDADG